MRIEANQMWSYFEWLFTHWGILQGALVAVGIAVLTFIACYFIAVWKYGPSEGFYAVTKVIYELLTRDLPNTSFRRIYALARLAFQEAIRRKVLVVIGIFIVAVMFGGWFLDSGTNNVAQLYISFVMTATSYLVLLLGLFLSCFSLPTDIKNKTIQTITTKPVRPTEIVLGRILGFSGVGTLMLAFMGLLSYFYVVRGVQHTHTVGQVSPDGTGSTTYDVKHEHTFRLFEDGSEGVTDEVKGHKHVVRKGPDGKYVIGGPEGLLNAKIPIFGRLGMTDREGDVTDRGLNVGYESEYHTFIEGGGKSQKMSAIWTFRRVGASKFQGGEELPIEMTLQAFRTFKGDIVTGVRGEVYLRNKDNKCETERKPFIVKEFAADTHRFKGKTPGFKNNEAQEIDIWEDICNVDPAKLQPGSTGEWEVVVKCTDPGQYLGMSTADLYLKAGDSRFGWNFFKGFLGIWLQMFIVISLGVMFSTFLSGPVGMVATVACLVLGFFGTLSAELASGKLDGGGPIESLIRMPMHSSATVELDIGNDALLKALQVMDKGIVYSVWSLYQAIPSFDQFNTSEFVAYGYNVPGGLLSRHITMAFGYFVMTAVIGYFFLKTRELASP
jgi:ABC-type transport system involved in multi-copper enzyme maturation permease subunit